MKTQRKAFTLIELLVVAAVLAILAGIAVPNLLEAQTRSKVARVRADLRTLAVGVEAYTTDHGQPPLDWSVGRGDPQLPGMASSTSGVLHPGRARTGGVDAGLTTPVAYIANCWIDDPFVARSDYATIPFDQQKYTYNWFMPNPNRKVPVNPDYVLRGYADFYGAWRLGSVGPDRDFFNDTGSLVTASLPYDSTNGTVSRGNIWRSQREGEIVGRPAFDASIDP